MYSQLLMKGRRLSTMPVGGLEGFLKISIKSFNVPAQVIKACNFRSRKCNGVQKRGHQATSAKTISVNEKYSDSERAMVTGILDFAKILTLTEITQDLRVHVIFGWNDKVGLAKENFCKGCAAVKS